MRRITVQNTVNGILFAMPWFIGFFAFVAYPIVASLYYGFTEYDALNLPSFVGFRNYIELFKRDTLFWKALSNTLFYTVFAVPIHIIVGLALALLLNLRVKGMEVYRTIYYLPTLVPAVASSVLWLWILNPQYGLVNFLLRKLGLPGPGWLADPVWAKPALILMSGWGAGSAVIIYLAGLQDIPVQLYEAAELDGATSSQKTFYITLPMLTPTIFFNLVMGLIGSFQYFTQAYVMTQGGPVNSTLFYCLYLYNNAFVYFKMGYASAMAWILFLIILAASSLVFRTSSGWVYYAAGH